ncbi:MAG TPA: YegS/Rv2252/BmrU family lipid kinase [Chryseolinea sp.]|nr:YegS/Rv2252/BmrU family lipid kinase [Chryseolinea sp.]
MNEIGKKVLFIINKYSGMGFQTTIEGRILDTCEKNDLECSIEYTQRRGHAISLSSEAANNGFSYVVAVGGDGTINEVARGLLHSETPMGILPRGSGNGLARHLGISVSLTDAIDNLFNHNIVRIDTLLINDKLSLNVSGIGFDGHVANLFANKKIRGLVGYVRISVQEYFRFQEFEAEVTVDNITNIRKAFIIAVANSSQYGNNIKIAPLASVRDGMFHLSIMKKIPLYRFDHIYSFLQGTITNNEMFEIVVGKELNIRTSQPVPYHIDGEPSGLNDTFKIQLQPASLSVMMPTGRRQDKV